MHHQNAPEVKVEGLDVQAEVLAKGPLRCTTSQAAPGESREHPAPGDPRGDAPDVEVEVVEVALGQRDAPPPVDEKPVHSCAERGGVLAHLAGVVHDVDVRAKDLGDHPLRPSDRPVNAPTANVALPAYIPRPHELSQADGRAQLSLHLPLPAALEAHAGGPLLNEPQGLDPPVRQEVHNDLAEVVELVGALRHDLSRIEDLDDLLSDCLVRRVIVGVRQLLHEVRPAELLDHLYAVVDAQRPLAARGCSKGSGGSKS